MKIHLLHFQGCPNVDAARKALRDALAAEQLGTLIEEIDVEDPAAPAWAHGWGSPTILIDGQDVAGQQPSGSSCCRLYADGAPSVEVIRARISVARGKVDQ
jgi:hypothetical protein